MAELERPARMTLGLVGRDGSARLVARIRRRRRRVRALQLLLVSVASHLPLFSRVVHAHLPHVRKVDPVILSARPDAHLLVTCCERILDLPIGSVVVWLEAVQTDRPPGCRRWMAHFLPLLWSARPGNASISK